MIMLEIAIVALMIGTAACGAIDVLRLRSRLAEKEEEATSLATRLHEMEVDVRHDRARLHEINSTVAGIASATQLIPTLRPDERSALESAVESEVLRLQRVLADDGVQDVRTIAVDEIIEHLVTSHRVRGRGVAWRASGARVVGHADDFAEAVNVLLENAARHGSADDIRITVTPTGDMVEVAVCDTGSGVDPMLRDRIFEWGERRPDSPGQGIGLYVAREQLRLRGGDLRLDDRHVGGARFLITLPAAVEHLGAPHEFALVG